MRTLVQPPDTASDLAAVPRLLAGVTSYVPWSLGGLRGLALRWQSLLQRVVPVILQTFYSRSPGKQCLLSRFTPANDIKP